MYDKGSRFKKVYSSTPAGVGPATYILFGTFENTPSGDGVAPFNSSEIRETTFVSKSLAENPGPKYRIRFRKQRIVGGTSLQNKAPRFKYKSTTLKKGPYPTLNICKTPGKVVKGVPPRNPATCVPSVPEKGTRGYDLTTEGPVKIYNPPQDRPIGPTTYYNPEGYRTYATETYKGNFWSLLRAGRFQTSRGEGPGPAEYHTGHQQESDLEKYQNHVRSVKAGEAPMLRTNDLLLRKLCRENLPGPGSYSPNDIKKKCECGKNGTFSMAKRADLYKSGEGPGPADYSDPRTAIRKVVSQVPPPSEILTTRPAQALPGPGHYDPKNSLWDDVQKRGRSKFARWNAPFDTSAERKTSFTLPDSACIPGPDWYFPQRKQDPNKPSSMFASKTGMNVVSKKQSLPGPAEYHTTELFKLQTNPRSHLIGIVPFLTTSSRPPLSDKSAVPGPGSYDVPTSSLNQKGCIIGIRLKTKDLDETPGPLDYVAHPKFAKSAVFNTHNVTLQKKETEDNSLGQKKIRPRKLRCFSLERKYPTRHCKTEIHPVY